jgi:hypothetical protein
MSSNLGFAVQDLFQREAKVLLERLVYLGHDLVRPLRAVEMRAGGKPK